MPEEGQTANHVLCTVELLGPVAIVQQEKPFGSNTPIEITPTTKVCRGRKKTNFVSLPCELRDMVYKECLTSRNRSFYRGVDKFRSRYDRAIGNGIKLMDPRFSTNQIAREACKVFYQHNTFCVKSHDVGEFLKIRLENFLEDKTFFTPEEWLRKVTIILVNQYNAQNRTFDTCHHLAGLKKLLTCSRLQNVEIELLGNNPVKTMVDIATICETIKKTIGQGFSIHGPRVCNGQPQCRKQDLSWMWQAPDYSLLEQMRNREKPIEEIMRFYVAAFLDMQFRGRAKPITDEAKAYRHVERWYDFWQRTRYVWRKKRRLKQG